MSVVCTECIVAKRCVVEQKLLLTAYRKSYMRSRLVLYQMNDLDVCIEVIHLTMSWTCFLLTLLPLVICQMLRNSLQMSDRLNHKVQTCYGTRDALCNFFPMKFYPVGNAMTVHRVCLFLLVELCV